MGEPLIAYILIAEFDIDRGSVLRHSIPSLPPGTEEANVVGIMLPEGAHAHGTDWTAWVSDERYRFVSTVRVKLDTERRRGADVKAMAVGTSHAHFPIECLRPLLLSALDTYFKTPGEATLKDVILPSLNALAWHLSYPLPVGISLAPTQRALLRGTQHVAGKSLGAMLPYASARDTGEEDGAYTPLWEGRAPWTLGGRGARGTALLRLPRWLEPSVAHCASLTALVRRFGSDVMIIYNAVLTGRRVLFLGQRGVPAGEVASAVLACAHMFCPPLPGGELQRRLFPHSTLSDLSFLALPGYVAGVTNPLFEGKREWWDVLAVLGPRAAEDGALLATVPGASPTAPGSLVRFSWDETEDAPAAVAGDATLASPPPPTAAGGSIAAAASGSLGAGGRVIPSGAPGSSGSSKGSDPKEQRCRVILSHSEFFWEPEDEKDDADDEGAALVGLEDTSELGEPSVSDETAPAASAVPGGDVDGASVGSSTPSAASAAGPAKLQAPHAKPSGQQPAHASAGAASVGYPAWRGLDAAFYARMRSGLRFGEHWARSAFEAYTATLLQLCPHILTGVAKAGAPAPPLPPRLARSLQLNRGRVGPLARGKWYAAFLAASEAEALRIAADGGAAVSDVWRVKELTSRLRVPGSLQGGGPVSSLLLAGPLCPWAPGSSGLDKMPLSEGMDVLDAWQLAALGSIAPGDLPPPPHAVDVLQELFAVLSGRNALQEYFLAQLPEASGGLHPLAGGLLCADVRVRVEVARLLDLLEGHPNTAVSEAVKRLNPVIAAARARHNGLLGRGRGDGGFAS